MLIRNDVMFVATYDDGSEEWFGIQPHRLWGGDHVAKAIAHEHQASGWLPSGRIISVTRKADLHSVA